MENENSMMLGSEKWERERVIESSDKWESLWGAAEGTDVVDSGRTKTMVFAWRSNVEKAIIGS